MYATANDYFIMAAQVHHNPLLFRNAILCNVTKAIQSVCNIKIAS